ncbi:Cysteine proteinases superfamily protein isoform 1 [Hibiscus syriacus]|uniref:Cysteine proteinases superfamily protein isoform 1 n=1 Tax=Hibiscus syriacus TaxID=106335 RepID=A0A6A2WEB5_HIBSY|nr:Cysteine proteinases superfamily protein isoform 1 [Hibiscus syriacus]
MEVPLVVVKMIGTSLLIGLTAVLIQVFDSMILTPRRLSSKLRKQGIKGPPPTFLLGNTLDIKRAQSQLGEQQRITHNTSSTVFPFFQQWTQQYGPTFLFSLGNIQILHIIDADLVKEIITCTSMDLGNPTYQQKERGPLLGKGILTSNGELWAHQRKIIAPELYMDKVKGMTHLMADCSVMVVNWWKSKVDGGGGAADIKVDDCFRRFTRDVISRACFGSNYAKGEEIFFKIRALQEAMSRKVLSNGFPGLRFARFCFDLTFRLVVEYETDEFGIFFRYLPTESNREIWRLEKEVRALILKAVNKTKEETSKGDLLEMILEGAKNSDLGHDATNNFIVDNCKNIYFAGYETTAITAAWTLLLLALNPNWQDKVRAEVLQICGGKVPDADMIRRMKTLTMVINETLRLYPPGAIISREALEDMKFGELHVPKGVNLWLMPVTLHQDPQIWGPDADKFNPQRFANGVSGACNSPHVYLPFGFGPHTCLGQHFALAAQATSFPCFVKLHLFSLPKL